MTDIEVLAAYLPYDVKLFIDWGGIMGSDEQWLTLLATPKREDLEMWEATNGISGDDYKGAKPILRPLSGLTEEERLELADLLETFDCDNFIRAFEEDSIYQMGFRKTQEVERYLLSKHVDLFGWIESGKAVNINEL